MFDRVFNTPLSVCIGSLRRELPSPQCFPDYIQKIMAKKAKLFKQTATFMYQNLLRYEYGSNMFTQSRVIKPG